MRYACDWKASRCCSAAAHIDRVMPEASYGMRDYRGFRMAPELLPCKVAVFAGKAGDTQILIAVHTALVQAQPQMQQEGPCMHAKRTDKVWCITPQLCALSGQISSF